MHPSEVVRHDEDDTYLVVAADKGTATFSDIANGVAESYGFWLGDAFASGGSAGYDHKGMGIHGARRLGVRQAQLPRAGPRHPDRGLHRGRHRRHVR
ncbi:NAD-glutamate dehydrogenase domain-containing protein [Kitasatospora albolonga]|uniref:NAD-glutamate dehydrogenase domain-containing protein n=1 Tax=Kitasatospora albolonga TaxID=68173 RepID=UPI003CD09DF8